MSSDNSSYILELERRINDLEKSARNNDSSRLSVRLALLLLIVNSFYVGYQIWCLQKIDELCARKADVNQVMTEIKCMQTGATRFNRITVGKDGCQTISLGPEGISMHDDKGKPGAIISQENGASFSLFDSKGDCRMTLSTHGLVNPVTGDFAPVGKAVIAIYESDGSYLWLSPIYKERPASASNR